MNATSIHLRIERGREQGLEIHVPAAGTRVGRSSKNDVVIQDPAASRFHCRFFFKPDQGLWAEDLGSANQTMLNNQPLTEARLQPDDRLAIGDTVFRVINNCPDPAAEAPAPLRPPAPPADEPAPATAAAGTADLAATVPIQNLFQTEPPEPPAGGVNFRRAPAGNARKRPPLKGVLGGLLAVLATGAALIWLYRLLPEPTAPHHEQSKPAADPELEIVYEKVQASAANIFRFHLLLAQNRLAIQVDDLQNMRHVRGDQFKPIAPDEIRELTEQIRNAGFFELREEYKGLGAEVWDVWDLAVTIDRQTHRVRVANTLEPEAFRATREIIEQFGETELGLTALALSPEKLLERAQQAFLLGRTLFDQRTVKNENLSLAIRALKDAELDLETIEPKPPFYAEAVALRGTCERQLQEEYTQYTFLADRAMRLRDWKEAETQLLLICEKIPDRADERHNNARKKLIDVQRQLRLQR